MGGSFLFVWASLSECPLCWKWPSYDEIDNERLARLHIYGTPPPIVEWDGWRTPSEGDIARLHTLVDMAEDHPPAPRNSGTAPDHRLGLEAPAWLLVGQDGLVTHLTHRPTSTAQDYAMSHPTFAPPGTTLPPPSLPSTSARGDPANAGITLPTITIVSADPANVGAEAPMDTQEGGSGSGPGAK